MTSNHFTPTEIAILRVLSDGQPHRPFDLHKCLPDELANVATVRTHISNMRKRLRPQGQDIICELRDRAVHYRHVKIILPGT